MDVNWTMMEVDGNSGSRWKLKREQMEVDGSRWKLMDVNWTMMEVDGNSGSRWKLKREQMEVDGSRWKPEWK